MGSTAMERSVAIAAALGGRRRSDRSRLAGALVVPERPAAEQQEQREDRELGRRDALLTAVAVVPGEDQDDGQADQECEERDLPELLAASGRTR